MWRDACKQNRNSKKEGDGERLRQKSFATPILLATALVLIDQISKLAARALIEKPVKLGVLQIVNVANSGTVFGLLKGSSQYLAALAAAAFIILIISGKKLKTKTQKVGLAIILAGIAGNTIDRLLRGYVTDFIYIKPWPAFNISDCLLFAGTAIMLIDISKKAIRKKKT